MFVRLMCEAATAWNRVGDMIFLFTRIRERAIDALIIRESISQRVRSNNDQSIAALVKQLRSPDGIIPFLGAGISAKFYRQWGAFLTGVSCEQLPEEKRKLVEEAVSKEDYLQAAGVIARTLGDHRFQQVIMEGFSDDRLAEVDLSSGMLGYVPLITSGPVITTNFDRLLENVFDRAGRPFQDSVYGANPHEVIPAIQQNRLVLWKIHGDRGDARARIFSDKDYAKHYRALPKLLVIAFLNRPALFIGCSLDKDRTTEVLMATQKQYPGTYHFAFVQIPEIDKEFDERVDELGKMGVRPIWYEKGEHHQIEKHLSDLVHDTSSLSLPQARRKTENTQRLTLEQARGLLSCELSEVEMGLGFAPPEVKNYKMEIPPYAVMVDKMMRGQMAFFLGAGACMGKLPLGRQFYKDLIREFDEDSEKYGNMDEPRIAQHFADKHGRDVLYSKVSDQLAQNQRELTVIHLFIAILHDYLVAYNHKPAQQWIFTTNYENWMEHALQLAGARYHLFSYRVESPHAGSFVYQSPDGAVRVVDRPSHFRRLSDEGPVLVKLHGGLHQGIDLPVSYVFTHRDFVELAGRMPDALPQVILDRLAERSLLFLGSGLGDDTIESLVRRMNSLDPKKMSWAIQFQPRPEKRLYWRHLGVKIVDITLQHFMLELAKRVEAYTAKL
jgi:hypothetical protein